MNVTVVGLGKIGLPLAIQFAMKGHSVIGSDINVSVVDQINNGIEPFPGEENLKKNLISVLESGNFNATTETTLAVCKSEVIIVVVPLIIDKLGIPDFQTIDMATEAIGLGLKPGALVSYETTLPVGTTRNRFAPNLEKYSGLKAGIDFHLVFSPERVLSGRVFSDLKKYPKIVGGLNAKSSVCGVQFYLSALDFEPRQDLKRKNGVWDVGSCETSEMVKLVETTYRDVNIGLANQFAIYAEKTGIDFHEVITAANSQPYAHIHNPGIAVGGHCIPVYPQLYLWNDPEASIVQAARIVNSQMPKYVVGCLENLHGPLDGERVVVMGASYRGDVKEVAFSGVFSIVLELRRLGAFCFVHDPLYTDDELIELGFLPYHFGQDVDAAILQADHSVYKELAPGDLPGVRTFLDGRQITSPALWEEVKYHQLGKAINAPS